MTTHASSTSRASRVRRVRYGDRDSPRVDRVLACSEPPRGTHYFLGAGVGPVTVDERMADHHIEVVKAAAAATRSPSQRL